MVTQTVYALTTGGYYEEQRPATPAEQAAWWDAVSRVESRRENYFNVQDWMIGLLGLKGATLSAFAAVWSITRGDANEWFMGGHEQIREFTGVSISTAKRAVGSLYSLGYILVARWSDAYGRDRIGIKPDIERILAKLEETEAGEERGKGRRSKGAAAATAAGEQKAPEPSTNGGLRVLAKGGSNEDQALSPRVCANGCDEYTPHEATVAKRNEPAAAEPKATGEADERPKPVRAPDAAPEEEPAPSAVRRLDEIPVSAEEAVEFLKIFASIHLYIYTSIRLYIPRGCQNDTDPQSKMTLVNRVDKQEGRTILPAAYARVRARDVENSGPASKAVAVDEPEGKALGEGDEKEPRLPTAATTEPGRRLRERHSEGHVIAGTPESRFKWAFGHDACPSVSYEHPDVDDVRAYARQEGIEVDAERFVATMEERCWLDGNGRPIKAWKKFLRGWAEKEAEFDVDRREREAAYKLAALQRDEKRKNLKRHAKETSRRIFSSKGKGDEEPEEAGENPLLRGLYDAMRSSKAEGAPRDAKTFTRGLDALLTASIEWNPRPYAWVKDFSDPDKSAMGFDWVSANEDVKDMGGRGFRWLGI